MEKNLAPTKLLCFFPVLDAEIPSTEVKAAVDEVMAIL